MRKKGITECRSCRTLAAPHHVVQDGECAEVEEVHENEVIPVLEKAASRL